MTILRDQPSSISNPGIVEFLAACDRVRDGGVMTRSLVESKEIFKYSRSLFISRWDREKNDFQMRYWGSQISQSYGMELTGKYFSEIGFGEYTQFFIDLHKQVIKDNTLAYINGTLDWRDKRHLKWDQVSMPLMRNGEINETLTFATSTRSTD